MENSLDKKSGNAHRGPDALCPALALSILRHPRPSLQQDTRRMDRVVREAYAAAAAGSVFLGVVDFFGVAFFAGLFFVAAAFFVVVALALVLVTRPDLVLVSTWGASTTAGAYILVRRLLRENRTKSYCCRWFSSLLCPRLGCVGLWCGGGGLLSSWGFLRGSSLGGGFLWCGLLGGGCRCSGLWFSFLILGLLLHFRQ